MSVGGECLYLTKFAYIQKNGGWCSVGIVMSCIGNGKVTLTFNYVSSRVLHNLLSSNVCEFSISNS